MTNKAKIILTLLTAAGVAFFIFKPNTTNTPAQVFTEIRPVYGNIQRVITATAVVQPQNRLEMKPPVAGRLDKIFVKEGQQVKAGEIVAEMSSTERAALIDATRSKGEKETGYWEDIYKPIALIAPIDGEVIVSTMQPGQTIAQTDPVVVLSNRLIVQAQVDETDIGKVKEGQSAIVSLDAYPDVKAKASVSHIYHESKVVNNVTIYQVDILPEEAPAVFRSGMSANVRIVQEEKNDVLMAPLEAVKNDKESHFVLIKDPSSKKPVKTKIEIGVSDEINLEIVSGVDENDTLLIPTQKYVASKSQKQSTNPLMPSRGPNSSRNSSRQSRPS